MAGDDSSRRRSSRRDHDQDRNRRGRDSSRDSDDRYSSEEDRRPRHPAPSRRRSYTSRHNESSEEEDSRDQRSRTSEKRRGSTRRPRSRSDSRSSSGRTRHRSRTRDVKRSTSRDRDKPLTEEELKSRRNKAIKAALTAGAFEAFRQRSRPGDWVGQKGIRVATAAISAGFIDAGLDKNPGMAGGAVGRLMTSALGGMVVDKIANGGSTGRKR